ncbi:hypothetical protein HDU76_007676 [Blyttiomyces sp. JEL0837]|nr:hypothetical protein HDU76_007676 [Blyttiomyces sp. JEL0837]
MPVEELLTIGDDTIVLIGVSGCGKTRSCYDYARHHWCLYFDCTKDADIRSMINTLESSKTFGKKTEESQQTFEDLSKKVIKSLIASRMLVLRILRGQKQNFEPYDWLCTQRSRRTRQLFKKIFYTVSSYSHAIVDTIFQRLEAESKEKVRVIFDESQHLLTILEKDYRSSKPEQRNIIVEPTKVEQYIKF